MPIVLPRYALVLMLAASCGTEPDRRPETAAYITDAILVPYCGRGGCHSTATKAHGLAFDTIPNALAAMHGTGRDGAPMLVPGDANGSRLFTVLADSGRIMPPDVPMPDADMKLIERWIDDGADGFQ